MYTIFLGLHNILRWVTLIAGIVAAVTAYLGWFGKREWSSRDRKLGMFFATAMDIQLLFGLLLYFIFSPLTKTALMDFGAAMKVTDLRFFAVEHVFFMVAALIFVHLGSALSRKAQGSKQKYQRAAIFFTIALLAILMGMPWSRPLFPGL
jgi:hypothetical protein